ncbi:MAG: hypothetical protein HY512_01980 [Candidatus Aenigmarchaeota archaeon]|nr:hypothetical protein [Candidatus Aenigmarchaeota archaeon]
MTKLRDYARSFAENLDARKAYRWASGLCAAAALTLVLDTSCVGDKYTPSERPKTDIQTIQKYNLDHLTDGEKKEAKDSDQQISDIAERLRRNIEIERRLREDVLRTGKVYTSHEEPFFNYSWMPSWVNTTFSRTVVDTIGKGYNTGTEKVTVTVSRHAPDRIDIGIHIGDSYHLIWDRNQDGDFEGYSGPSEPPPDQVLQILDRLAPSVDMENKNDKL